MINNLLKVGTLIVTGRFLKPRIKGLLALIIFWIIVRLLHAEFISYVELSDDTRFIWQASLLKISFYILAFFVYLYATERKILLANKQKNELTENNSNFDSENKDDGFDFLRQKKKLDSKSEQLLKKQ